MEYGVVRSPDSSALPSRLRRCDGTSSRPSIMRSPRRRRIRDAEYWHNEGAIEVVVAHLARSLGDERTTVACGPWSQRFSMLVPGACWRRSDHWSTALHAQGQQEVVFNVPSLLHQPPSVPPRPATGVEENPKTICRRVRVDSFANGAGWVTAAHGKRLNEQVREGVQQHIGPPGNGRLALRSSIQILCPVARPLSR